MVMTLHLKLDNIILQALRQTIRKCDSMRLSERETKTICDEKAKMKPSNRINGDLEKLEEMKVCQCCLNGDKIKVFSYTSMSYQ